MTEVEQVRRKLMTKKDRSQVVQTKDLLSTGSTTLNLACSGRIEGGFAKGMYVFFVGDSDSGKTFLCMTCLAEATKNPNFDDYRFIYDSPEDGALMDIAKFFGRAVAKRLERQCSNTIEDFYYNTDDDLKDGRPFIKILDSMDSLTSEDEEKKFQQHKKAAKKARAGVEEKVAGSYGDGKPKKNSQGIRRLLNKLKASGSILIIINQTRDNIGQFVFEKKTRSGGHALTFYAAIEIWSSIKQILKKPVKNKKRQIGILSKVLVKRTRITGKKRSVEIPIYHSFGIDDIGSCVDYLIDEGHWKKNGSAISAPEFEFHGKRPELIRLIEDEDSEEDLRNIVAQVWQEIEESCVVHRKKRY